jgi:hypothetical protein
VVVVAFAFRPAPVVAVVVRVATLPFTVVSVWAVTVTWAGREEVAARSRAAANSRPGEGRVRVFMVLFLERITDQKVSPLIYAAPSPSCPTGWGKYFHAIEATVL